MNKKLNKELVKFIETWSSIRYVNGIWFEEEGGDIVEHQPTPIWAFLTWMDDIDIWEADVTNNERVLGLETLKKLRGNIWTEAIRIHRYFKGGL